MNAAAPFAVLLVLMGPVLTSFLTTMAERHCAGRDWVREPSRCAHCRARIGARDLVPILSWLRLRGRCRDCGQPIPRHLLWGEVAGLGAAIVALVAASGPLDQGLSLAFLVLLVGLFQADRLCLRLPDAMTLPLAAVGLGLGTGTLGFQSALAGAVIGPGALWLLSWIYQRARGRAGLGLGDVKMMVGVGGAVGLSALPWVTLAAALAALAAAALSKERMRGDLAVPFGCYIAVAGGAVWFIGRLASA